MSAATCACGAMVDLTGDVPMAGLLAHQRTPWHIRRMRRIERGEFGVPEQTSGSHPASVPTTEEVVMTERTEADTLRAEAAAIDHIANEDERAAAAIGFGSDRAVRARATARRYRAKADAIEPVATPDTFLHKGSDPEADDAWDGSAMVEVRVDDVPRLVRAGIEVWSFGYGWDQGDLEVDEFTTLQDDDLWAFVGPDRDADTVSSWGPFAVSFEDGIKVYGTPS